MRPHRAGVLSVLLLNTRFYILLVTWNMLRYACLDRSHSYCKTIVFEKQYLTRVELDLALKTIYQRWAIFVNLLFCWLELSPVNRLHHMPPLIHYNRNQLYFMRRGIGCRHGDEEFWIKVSAIFRWGGVSSQHESLSELALLLTY